MNVCFLPWYPTNPYQDQLASNLRSLGAEVTLLTARKFLDPRVVLRMRPDVLHLHWLQAYIVGRNILLAWMKAKLFLFHLVYIRSRGVKIVWTIHELRDHERQNPLLDRLCNRVVARLCHVAIVHCEAAKLVATRELGIHPDKLAVVPHGNYEACYSNNITRDKARKSLQLPQEAVVLLFIGVIKPYKGLIELIDAFCRLQGDDVYLVIAGRPYRDDLGAAIRARIDGKPNISFFPGFLPDDDIQVFLNASDCTVFPYRDILTSGSILLSMTFGRACVAPRIGCVAEDLDDEGGFLYDPEAEDGLYGALRRVIEHREQLAQMGSHNRTRALRASWDGIARKTAEVYQTGGRSRTNSRP